MLFLGGGKRVSLAQRFIDAGKRINKDVNIFSYEINQQQPISVVAKIIDGKRWDDPDVVEHIFETLVRNKIDLLVSNVDPALKTHSILKESHQAAKYCSDLSQVEACYSKKQFQEKCENLEIPVIPAWDRRSFPMLAKPDFGSASQGIQVFESMKAIEQSDILESGLFCLQKYIRGIEFTVDAYVSQTGEVLTVSPRVRSETLGGESVSTQTVYDDTLIDLSVDVMKKLDLKGPITLQFIREESSDVNYLMEVNTRLGGGVICSIEAGFDIPMLMLNELCGIANNPVLSGRSVLMKRYFSEVFYAINS